MRQRGARGRYEAAGGPGEGGRGGGGRGGGAGAGGRLEGPPTPARCWRGEKKAQARLWVSALAPLGAVYTSKADTACPQPPSPEIGLRKVAKSHEDRFTLWI